MKVPVVRLKLRVRLPDGSRSYLDTVFAGNNKLKPGYASFEGKPVLFPDGVYHLRYLKGLAAYGRPSVPMQSSPTPPRLNVRSPWVPSPLVSPW